MKKSDLIRKLQKAGYEIIHGGSHDMAIHPDKLGKIPVPQHNEINEYTAKGILKDAGLL
ncbi:hypothetical protein FACS189490_13150 [Clostridia bacterium]|nr:hypothetical protein FACS189490_13150 [Clostridia bacterium]